MKVAALVAATLAGAGVSAQTSSSETAITPVPASEAGPPRDYVLPALEIIGFDFLVNRINRNVGST
jgi:hypothetical protein